MATALSRGIRVIIVDDHQVVREGLRLLIQSQPGFKVVGDAGTSKEALAIAAREQPDIILLDLDLGTESGTEIIPKLLATAKRARVLALTGLRDPELHRQAILHGAMGVVQKEKAAEVLLKAIEKINAGEIWYDRSKLGSVLADALRGPDAREANSAAGNGPALTPRESEIVALVSQGLQNKQIAEKLFISHITVRHHLTSIFEKVGVSSRLELIVYAFNQGLAKVNLRKDHQVSRPSSLPFENTIDETTRTKHQK